MTEAELAITSANRAPALRSLAYARLVAAFDYPDAAMIQDLRSGNFATTLAQLLDEVDSGLGRETDWGALRNLAPNDDDLLTEYTRLFVAGPDGPACGLEEGAHLRTPMETMEDVLRFYRYFGVRLPEKKQESPDHLTTELEFLHYLTYQEAREIVAGNDASGLQRAQRDFIERHPGAWVPLLHEKLVARGAMPFFVELAQLLRRYLVSESQRLDTPSPMTNPEA